MPSGSAPFPEVESRSTKARRTRRVVVEAAVAVQLDVVLGEEAHVAGAVGANGEYMKLGEVVTTGNRNEAQIKTETIMPDFGLLITMESAIGASPVGPGVAHIHIVP